MADADPDTDLRREVRRLREELNQLKEQQANGVAAALGLESPRSRRQALKYLGGGAAAAALLGGATMDGAQADAVAADVGTQADPWQKVWTHALEVGDGANAVDFDSPWTANHNAISSATTITDANVIPYDCSVSGFTITLGSELEENGGWAVLIDQTGNAGTNAVTITANSNIDGGANITVNHDHAVTTLWWDGSEWRSTRFIDTVDAGKLATDIEDVSRIAGSRSFDTEYTNGNDYNLFVSVSVESDGTQDINVTLRYATSGGTPNLTQQLNVDAGDLSSTRIHSLGPIEVPPGGEYELRQGAGNAATIKEWVEWGRT